LRSKTFCLILPVHTGNRLSLAELLSSLEASLAHFAGTSDRLVQHISRIDAYMHSAVDFTFLIDPPTTEGHRDPSKEYSNLLNQGVLPPSSSYTPVRVFLYLSPNTQACAQTHSRVLRSLKPGTTTTGRVPRINISSSCNPSSRSLANNHRGLNSIPLCSYLTSLSTSGPLISVKGQYLMLSLAESLTQAVCLIITCAIGSSNSDGHGRCGKHPYQYDSHKRKKACSLLQFLNKSLGLLGSLW
jgi:hypothetical protein